MTAMLRISELRLPLDHPAEALPAAILQRLGISAADLTRFTVFKRSYDARKNARLTFIYIVDAEVNNEAALLQRFAGDLHVKPTPDMEYHFVGTAPPAFTHRPVIIGFGPCGLFAALILAQMPASGPSCSNAARPCANAPRTPGACGARTPSTRIQRAVRRRRRRHLL
jgi:uncharacterized FAD-dependent dehydrogenase